MSQGARISSVMRYSSYGLVRQLVVAAVPPREMPSQQCPHALDTRDRALAKAPGAVMQLHLPAHRLPLRLCDAGSDAAVGDDLDHPVRHEHVDQDTLLCAVSHTPSCPKQLQRALPRRQIAPQLRQIEGRLDDEADLPA